MTEQTKPHLSPSALDTMSKCGFMWKFRYIDGIIIPPGFAMVMGSGTHTGIQADLQHKIETGELLGDDAVADAAADGVKNKISQEGVTVDEEGADVKALTGDAIDGAVDLATLYHREVCPTIQPVSIEREYLLEISGFPYDLKGFADLEEPSATRDWKTTKQTPSPDAADRSTQLPFYSLCRQQSGEPAPTETSLDFLVKLKTKSKFIRLNTKVTADDHDMLLKKLVAASKVIESGAFFPAFSGAWWCAPQWCGFWNICDYGRKNKKQF